MRSLVVALALLAFATTVDAKPRRAKKSIATKNEKSTKKRAKQADRSSRKRKRVGMTTHKHPHFEIRGPIVGQSVGAPWSGRLRDAAKLAESDTWYIRRPYRSYGTRTTVDFVQRVLSDIADRFPDIHKIAIGDISAETGGQISDHSSHQSGRDIDIGLIFSEKPDGYPNSFVVGTEDNLDLEATFVMVEEFAKTTREQGGVLMIFLDFNVQKLLYDWALENGESEDYLGKLFQYPHGRGSSEGIVRHEPNHRDHIHVRFRCPAGDSACR
ncbi:MAG TPA: penicillin-insensitive murein endopeptidase [Kofleriaceae bacterium]|nr:penicillin-insensitive murein endopeptidase [Kofleriaceae bacterium]